jgi:transposase
MVGMAIDDREVSASGLADAKPAGGKRRRWPDGLKREVVAALSEPGASVSIVARRYDVNANQLFKWRRQFDALSGGATVEPMTLLPVTVAVSPGPPVLDAAPPFAAMPTARPTTAPTNVMPGSIEIVLSGGVRVKIKGSVDPVAVSAAVGAVMAPRRRR